MTINLTFVILLINNWVDDKAEPVPRSDSFDFYDNKIKTDGNRTEYVYTATGEKLRTIHTKAMPFVEVRLHSTAFKDTMGWSNPGGPLKPITDAYEDSTDYIGNFVFDNGKPDKYLFSGGYYSYAKSSLHLGIVQREAFHYYITDHLGNNCVVVSDNDSIEQVTHYYPFGAVYADAGLSPGFQKYKYTGKELDLTHGLNTYDHGARQNYSILGVWDRIDPLCEKYYNVSPYVVCNNNPINYNDKNGKFPNREMAEIARFWYNLTHMNKAGPIVENEVSNQQFNFTFNTFESSEGTFEITCNYKFNTDFFKGMQDVGDVLALAGYGVTLSVAGAEIGIPLAAIGNTISSVGNAGEFVLDLVNGDYAEGGMSASFILLERLTGSVFNKVLPGYGKKIGEEGFDLGTEILDQGRKLKISGSERISNLVKEKMEENEEEKRHDKGK